MRVPPAPPETLWGNIPLPSERNRPFTLGSARFWLGRHSHEVECGLEIPPGLPTATLHPEELEKPAPPPGPTSEAPPPEDLRRRRFAFTSAPDHLRLLPRLPDRPVVLAAAPPLDLRPGSRVRLYVAVPIWGALLPPEGRGEDQPPLVEIPSLVLSSTWFGDFAEGEMCYWLPTRAGSAPDEVPRGPHLATCPIQVTNRSTEPLLVDKLCLRVAHASLFLVGDQLWTDPNQITYLGGGDFSRIQWSGTPPPAAAGEDPLSPPRTPLARGLTAWTFDRLRGIPGLGGR